MNTPLTIIEQFFPQEVLNIIQSYLINDIAKKALIKYYDYLYEKKISDDEEIYNNYVYPLCVCRNCPDNGKNKIFIRKECWHCDEYDMNVFLNNYACEQFILCIKNNLQYTKIAHNINNYNRYYNSDDDEIWYNENSVWLE